MSAFVIQKKVDGYVWMPVFFFGRWYNTRHSVSAQFSSAMRMPGIVVMYRYLLLRARNRRRSQYRIKREPKKWFE